jgi:hypothetical protein
MITQEHNSDNTTTYTVTDHRGRLIGRTQDRAQAELWEHRGQWRFKQRAGLAAAQRVSQNAHSHLVYRNRNQ